MYQPDVLMLLVDPHAPELAAEVVEWFDDINMGKAPRVEVADGQKAVLDALRVAGYVEAPDEPFGLDQRSTARRLRCASPWATSCTTRCR